LSAHYSRENCVQKLGVQNSKINTAPTIDQWKTDAKKDADSENDIAIFKKKLQNVKCNLEYIQKLNNKHWTSLKKFSGKRNT
jgi:hypothetical protein